MSESAGVAITTVSAILIIVDIVGNSLVCLIIKRNPDMRNPINYLLVNLAVADILFAMFIVPNIILRRLKLNHPDGMTGTVLCKLLTGASVAWVGAAASIVTLVAVAIERYYAVTYPLGNKRKLTTSKLKVIIPGSWIFSSILNIPEFVFKDIDNKINISCVPVWPEKWMGEAYGLTWLVFVGSSLALMVGLYSRVVYTLWCKRNGDNQLTYQQRGVIRMRKRVTSMVLTVSALFGICWGTNITCFALIMSHASYINPIAIAVSQILVLFNSAVNPFVYALLNQKFREKIKGMICCTGGLAERFHPTRSPQNILHCRSVQNQPDPNTRTMQESMI